MRTRQATEADIAEIVRVINAAFRVEDFFINGDRTGEEDIALRMADPAVDFLVADGETTGALAGVVVVDIHGQRGHFAMLSVHPLLQGRGVGRLLMNAVENHCRLAGCDLMEIEVVNLREELAAFYLAAGYEQVDTAPFPNPAKLRREAHMVLMSKRLVP